MRGRFRLVSGSTNVTKRWVAYLRSNPHACIEVGVCVWMHASGWAHVFFNIISTRPGSLLLAMRCAQTDITWTEDRRGEQVELPGSPLPFLTQPCTSHAAPLCSFAFALSAASLALSRFHLAVALRFPFSIFDLTCDLT